MLPDCLHGSYARYKEDAKTLATWLHMLKSQLRAEEPLVEFSYLEMVNQVRGVAHLLREKEYAACFRAVKAFARNKAPIVSPSDAQHAEDERDFKYWFALKETPDDGMHLDNGYSDAASSRKFWMTSLTRSTSPMLTSLSYG
ncbi:hypothetical protein ANO11243_042470 [Dothideomycetidae sp. 11243]|nr:hypothetical protein ANO11243_042470 [fungal sp. No.11243]